MDENLEQLKIVDDLVLDCQKFLLRHPIINDPTQVLIGGSFLYSDLFYLEISQLNHELRVLHVQGQREVLKNRHPAFFKQENPSLDFYHTVCIVDGKYIVDVSAKFIDTKGHSVLIMTPEKLNKDWLMIGSSYDAIEQFNNIGSFLNQSTKKWQLKEFPDRNQEDIKKSMDEYFQLAKNSYQQTLNNVTLNHLVFTESSEFENPLLSLFINKWRPIFEES